LPNSNPRSQSECLMRGEMNCWRVRWPEYTGLLCEALRILSLKGQEQAVGPWKGHSDDSSDPIIPSAERQLYSAANPPFRGPFSEHQMVPTMVPRCPLWCRPISTSDVAVGISLHRSDGKAPDFVSKDRRRKLQVGWSLRRQLASANIDLHQSAPKVRETGVEPARVSPLDPKSSASANSATLASLLFAGVYFLSPLAQHRLGWGTLSLILSLECYVLAVDCGRATTRTPLQEVPPCLAI
jgi:hypothetical protein